MKQLLAEERAVSPVIGVILMVAITVILAAVIGTFVLGLGQNVNSTPSASFSFDFEGNSAGDAYTVNITHEGGDTLNSDNAANINVTASSHTTVDWLANNGGPIQAGTTCSFGDEGTTAEDCTTEGSNYNIPAGETVRVVFIGSDGNSATLSSQDAPTSA